MIVGPKRSGKGTVARVQRALVGPANVCGPTLASLGTNFGLWPLLGKSLGIISDARLGRMTDSQVVVERLLSISGEDALTIDRKNLEPVTCKLPTRMMILSNELPRLGDSSGALSGRMIVLRLTKSFFGQEDHDLSAKLMTGLPGILLWAIEGWRRLRDRGRFIQPQAALEMVEELEDLTSPIAEFVRDCCKLEEGAETVRHDVYVRYLEWCKENGKTHPDEANVFGRNLRAAVPNLRDSQPRDSEKRVRKYIGIRLA
jgi:putative DNA primase/helicase